MVRGIHIHGHSEVVSKMGVVTTQEWVWSQGYSHTWALQAIEVADKVVR